MKVLIMYSGGVESTALIQHATKWGHNIDLLHVTHNRSSTNEMASAKLMGNRLFELQLIKPEIDKHLTDKHKDVVMWMSGAMMVAAKGDYQEVWHGKHSMDPGLPSIPLMTTSWNAMMKILELKTKLLAPLHEYSKRAQYDMLTSYQKSCIVSCRGGNYDAPCNKCVKCQEFKQLVEDVA